MSVTITISDEVYQKLQNVAQGRGFEKVEEFLDKWEEPEAADRREVVDRILKFHEKMKKKYGVMPDSTEILREDRMRG